MQSTVVWGLTEGAIKEAADEPYSWFCNIPLISLREPEESANLPELFITRYKIFRDCSLGFFPNIQKVKCRQNTK